MLKLCILLYLFEIYKQINFLIFKIFKMYRCNKFKFNEMINYILK